MSRVELWWPETIRVFLDHQFLCVGCPIGCFHSISEACRAHQFELEPFLRSLRTVGAGVPVGPG
ncbi:hypothetical protein IP69_06410 [Bosea sp. AAP35]|nr:hypothetical protein IP69_06410 [Bosea sp. AAP35]